MMERLDDYKRPFHQRATVMVLPPLNPAEVGDLLGCSPADALDAYLVTGGLPLICQEWQPGKTLESSCGSRSAIRLRRCWFQASGRSRPNSPLKSKRGRC